MSRLPVFVLTIGLAGCALRSQSPLPYMQSSAALRVLDDTGAGKVTHIVYIVQENRSFDNMFQGYPGADTVSHGKDSSGKTIALQPVSLKLDYNIDHSSAAMFAACNGTGKLPGTDCRMNGFNKEQSSGGPANPEYVFVQHRDSKPYWDMAHEWVVADKMFQSQLDESFVAHQYVIAAQAAWSVNLPFETWGCVKGSYDVVHTITPDRKIGGTRPPCYDYQTLGDELDKAKLSWRFYAAGPG
ncbi:MAG: alkaline phosphatase family protein, partial [Candidatus Cybelea sp.]